VASRGGNNKNGPASFYLSSSPSTITELLRLQKNITSPEQLSYVVELQNQTLPYSIYIFLLTFFLLLLLPLSVAFHFWGKKPNYKEIGLLLTTHQSKPLSKNPISSQDRVQRDKLQRETNASERASTRAKLARQKTKQSARQRSLDLNADARISSVPRSSTIIHCHPLI
jgi:hypothetical protein